MRNCHVWGIRCFEFEIFAIEYILRFVCFDGLECIDSEIENRLWTVFWCTVCRGCVGKQNWMVRVRCAFNNVPNVCVCESLSNPNEMFTCTKPRYYWNNANSIMFGPLIFHVKFICCCENTKLWIFDDKYCYFFFLI